MKDKKIYSRCLILFIFAVIFSFMFVITKVGYCYSEIIWIQWLYYICVYGFFLTIIASIIVSFLMVYKESYNMIWLIELLSLVGFFLLVFNLSILACSGLFKFNWEYMMILYEMFFVNTFNGICRLNRKSKNFKEDFMGLIKEPVKDHAEEKWGSSKKDLKKNNIQSQNNMELSIERKDENIEKIEEKNEKINIVNGNNRGMNNASAGLSDIKNSKKEDVNKENISDNGIANFENGQTSEKIITTHNSARTKRKNKKK